MPDQLILPSKRFPESTSPMHNYSHTHSMLHQNVSYILLNFFFRTLRKMIPGMTAECYSELLENADHNALVNEEEDDVQRFQPFSLASCNEASARGKHYTPEQQVFQLFREQRLPSGHDLEAKHCVRTVVDVWQTTEQWRSRGKDSKEHKDSQRDYGAGQSREEKDHQLHFLMEVVKTLLLKIQVKVDHPEGYLFKGDIAAD